MPLSLLCSRTIGETIKDTRQEPLGLLADVSRILVLRIRARLAPRHREQVIPVRRAQRHVRVS